MLWFIYHNKQQGSCEPYPVEGSWTVGYIGILWFGRANGQEMGRGTGKMNWIRGPHRSPHPSVGIEGACI